MRRSAVGVLLFATVGLVGCGERPARSLSTSPNAVLRSEAPACPDSAGIVSQITAIFPSTYRSTALARFYHITALLGPVPPGPNPAAARDTAIALIGYTLQVYRGLASTGSSAIPTQASVTLLINGLLCFVGLPSSFSPDNLGNDGAAGVVTPTSPTTTITTGSKFAGVQIGAGSATQTVLVTIVRLPDSPGPLLTQLDQYPLFYEFTVTPAGSSFTLPVVIGACQATSIVPPDPSRLRIAHNVAPYTPGSIEILPYAPAPFLNCTNADVSALRSTNPLANLALAGWRAIRPILSTVLGPDRLMAATSGVGGTVRNFSPFGAVDTLVVMTPNSPTSQQGTTQSAVAAPPSVTVHTPTGRPFSGLAVQFGVTAGGGSLTGASTATDASGIATVGSWILGPTAGLNSVAATAAPPQVGTGVTGSPLTFSANAVAPLITLVNCPPSLSPGHGAQDGLTRAFYLPRYPGSSLAQVNLYLSADFDPTGASHPGPFTIQLTARSGGFNGPVIGTSTATVTLAGLAAGHGLTPFAFTGAPLVTRNSTVTFQFSVASSRDRAALSFDVGSCGLGNTHCGTNCPVVETNDASGTLSTFRRQGCGITIIGRS